MRRKKPCNLVLSLTRICAALLSLSSGAFSIAVLCVGPQESCFNEAALIIILIGAIMNAMVQIALAIRDELFFKFISIFPLSMTLGSGVCYIKFLIERLPTTNISSGRAGLVTAHLSILLSTLLLSGASSSLTPQHATKESVKVHGPGGDMEPGNNEQTKVATKTVAMKNSSQTLTPEHDFQEIYSHQNWMNKYSSTYSGSESASATSVVKHSLEAQASQNSAQEQMFADPSRKISKKPKVRSFLRMRPKNKVSKDRAVLETPQMDESIQAHYVTRLSTIQDNSKSFLNVTHNLQHRDVSSKSARSSSLLSDHGKATVFDEDAFLMEKNAVHRINSALLPPSLRASDKDDKNYKWNSGISELHNSPPTSSVTEDGLDLLQENDLEDIPQAPDWSKPLDTNADTPKLLKKVNFQDWQTHSDRLLESERILSESSPKLLPGLLFQPKDRLQPEVDFSFPAQKPKLDFDDFLGHNNDDTVSELDILFRREEGGLTDKSDTADFMESILKQNDVSTNLKRLSKEMSFTSGNHSPTKSMTSIITNSANGSFKYPSRSPQKSPSKSPSKFGSMFSNAGHSQASNHIHHSRSNSQITAFLHTVANKGNTNSSVQSSPTRGGRLRRSFSKKMSLSSISFKQEEDECLHEHIRGKSIDFSYVHSLQNKHSPSKSLTLAGRRNSMFAPGDLKLRTVSAIFSEDDAGHNSTVSKLKQGIGPTEDVTNQKTEDSSTRSSQSITSETHYPQAVIGEYDREKWSTLLSMSLIDSPKSAAANY
ncbi:Irc8p [Lachancea thermotolerans CBS 6340]|uniref:KLTH0H10428p n=1 Tax=Lachancea thermotolerans (strain ATCC 56472 / CBS 6340 / NRRL Y-8284) TaxID=559295 RepID=C5E351_LACTC|nr:KLTH0H10428p [Lachancea thermotolerans CBS 6340]CAR30462.1 KLTH0H10428p [Lachancea thermotolerans CBS 6340]